MDAGTLPQILAARRSTRRLHEAIAEYVAAMRRAARSEDRSALHALAHWLESQPEL
jgi:hypothetical protein